jgi:hypothetical protein
MADTTISGLSPSTPNKDTAIIPFSDGSTTYKTSPSGIVAASPGSVIQVVSVSNIAEINIGDSPGYINNLSITPKFASSKILVTMGTIAHRTVGNTSDYYEINLVRNSWPTRLSLLADAALYQSLGNGQREFYCTTYLDSPNTTSSVSYRGYVIRLNGTSGSSYATFNISNTGYITLQEIAG